MNLYHGVFICMACCLYCGTADWAPHCCLKTSNKRIPVNRLVNYSIQTAGLCPVNAIVFKTVRGRQLCNNPDLDWVKQAMKKIDQRKEESAGSSSGPAISTKPKKRPRKNKNGKRKGKNQKRKTNR